MKVYISVDMEGIGGVVSLSHVLSGSKEYERFRKWLTEEVLAVIEGAREAGATKITVADSHGGMTNILIEDLPENVEVVSGFPRPICMMHGIWEGYDTAFFIGYHARKGTRGAIMDHTIAGRIFRYIKINQKETSEFYLNALLAGFYNIPVSLLSGDAAICREAKTAIPGIEVVITKQGITRWSAKTKTLKSIKRELKEAAIRAIKKVRERKIKPLRIEDNIILELGFYSTDTADIVEMIPGAERVDGLTVVFKTKNILEAYKLIELAMIIGMGIDSLVQKMMK
ncbi:MAG: M55 family metallopeptidase [Candidatus Njordarchaeales archaeon]